MQGLDALGYSEHIDYDLVESTNPAFQKAIVRVNVFRDHRQVSYCTACIYYEVAVDPERCEKKVWCPMVHLHPVPITPGSASVRTRCREHCLLSRHD